MPNKEYKFLMNDQSELTLDDLRELLLDNEVKNFDPVAEQRGDVSTCPMWNLLYLRGAGGAERQRRVAHFLLSGEVSK